MISESTATAQTQPAWGKPADVSVCLAGGRRPLQAPQGHEVLVKQWMPQAS